MHEGLGDRRKKVQEGVRFIYFIKQLHNKFKKGLVSSILLNSFTTIRLRYGDYPKSLCPTNPLQPLLFAIVVNVVAENARRDVVNELLYADGLVLMSETIKDLNKKFWN